MGYRTNLYIIEKKSLEKLQNISKRQLYKQLQDKIEEGYLSKTNILNHFNAKKIFELGGFYTKEIEEQLQSVFTDPALIQEMKTTETDFREMDKEGIKVIVEYLRKEIHSFYLKQKQLSKTLIFLRDKVLSKNQKNIKIEDLKKEIKKNHGDEYKFFNAIESNVSDKVSKELIWNSEYGGGPYDFEEQELTDSWKYEYAIFELVRLYKTIDHKNYSILYIGG